MKYQAPKIEKILTLADFEREAHFAGTVTSGAVG